jgi:hypothetical protein
MNAINSRSATPGFDRIRRSVSQPLEPDTDRVVLFCEALFVERRDARRFGCQPWSCGVTTGRSASVPATMLK